MQFDFFIYSSQKARKPICFLILQEWLCQSCRCKAKANSFKILAAVGHFASFNVLDFLEKGSFPWYGLYIKGKIYSGTLIYTSG